jgi:hypothetical protein
MDSDIVLPWSKIKHICFLMGYSLNKHPTYFPWEDIGLKHVPDTHVWKLRIIDKNKLTFAMIKYNFNLLNEL